MSHTRWQHFGVVKLTAVFIFFAGGIAIASEAATAPATQPALPRADQVQGLDDSALYGVFQLLFPDPTAVENQTIAGNDSQAPLKREMWSELDKRADARLKSLLASERFPRLDTWDEPALFLVVRGAWRYSGRDSDAQESLAQRRERVGPIVRQVIERGGRPCDFALAQCHLDDVTWMSKAQLRDFLPRVRGATSSWHEQGRNRERMLCEIVRRAGAQSEQTLAAELHQVEQAPNNGWSSTGYLETLTALRRVQGKPDPFHIELAGPANLESVFPSLPAGIEASLVNVDNDPIPFTRGGDYRSGRQARWRIEARDGAGKLVPEREMLGFMGGGIYNLAELTPGEKWRTRLDIGSFLHALPPGDYTLRVLYHDSLCIADEPNVDGLIVSSSPTIKLTVKPLEIPEAKVNAAKIRELLASIDEKAKVKVVGGSYGAWAYDLVPPDSPQGKLLAIGFPAIPPMLEFLDDPKLKPHRRAVILSLLYSLTGQNDPTSAGPILGPYKKSDGPWSVVQDGGGGLGWGGGENAPQADLNLTKQLEFARRWSAWKQYVKIVPDTQPSGK